MYPLFLGAQVHGRDTSQDVRILVVDADELVADARARSTEFEIFYLAHVDHRIRLLTVPPEKATEIAAHLAITRLDVGIFQWQYVVWYRRDKAEPAGKWTLQLEPISKGLRGNLESFLSMLNEHAREIGFENRKLTLIERDEKVKAADKARLLCRGRFWRMR